VINPDLVFDSVRRGYNALEQASNDEILSYFEDINPDAMIGHVNNIKGILFEQVYVNQLAEQGIQAEVFELTNHPGADITIFEDGEVINELQMKATDSMSYISTTIEENPDIAIVATNEVASAFGSAMVIDSEIENAVLESSVLETLTDDAVNPVSPLSILGWLIGLPF
jgi:hypothetical protein